MGPSIRSAALSGLIALSLVACGDATGPLNLLSHWSDWNDHRPDTYTYQFQRGCFCLDLSTQAVWITVQGQEVVEVTRVSDGQPVAPGDVDLFFRITIDSLFAIVGHAMERHAADLRVTFAPVYGYPATASIDYDAMIADDEVSYAASLNVPGR